MSDNPTELARRAVDEKLNVRKLEDMLRVKKNDPRNRTTALDLQKAKEMEKSITKMLDLKSKVVCKASGAGSITIYFETGFTRDRLMEILAIACNASENTQS
jgi:hypothetical protein